jgi:hypothetical protein
VIVQSSSIDTKALAWMIHMVQNKLPSRSIEVNAKLDMHTGATCSNRTDIARHIAHGLHMRMELTSR